MIGNTEEIKLLGVTLDKDLHFSKQIAGIVLKVDKQIQILYSGTKNLIIDVNNKFRLYNACILPHLTYCSVICDYCGRRN